MRARRNHRVLLAPVLAIAALLAVGTLAGCGPTKASSAGSKTATETPPPPVAPPATEFAKNGAPLKLVVTPPKEMITQIQYSKERDNSAYSVDFEVYGLGEQIGGSPTVVVKMGVTVPQSPDNTRLPIDGKNAALVLGKGVNMTVGGSYKGVVKCVRNGDTLQFVLTEAKRL